MCELNTVKVPPAMEPLFEKAQDLVRRYFKDRNFSPEQGTIMIGDQRYILMRAESVSASFLENVHTSYHTLDDMDVFSVAVLDPIEATQALAHTGG